MSRARASVAQSERVRARHVPAARVCERTRACAARALALDPCARSAREIGGTGRTYRACRACPRSQSHLRISLQSEVRTATHAELNARARRAHTTRTRRACRACPARARARTCLQRLCARASLACAIARAA
eukprot:444398-Pyramimonas_sp.AAC.1